MGKGKGKGSSRPFGSSQNGASTSLNYVDDYESLHLAEEETETVFMIGVDVDSSEEEPVWTIHDEPEPKVVITPNKEALQTYYAKTKTQEGTRKRRWDQPPNDAEQAPVRQVLILKESEASASPQEEPKANKKKTHRGTKPRT